jgi:hypothetical protein
MRRSSALGSQRHRRARPRVRPHATVRAREKCGMRIPGSEDPDLRRGSVEATRRLAFGPGHRLLDSDHERLGALRDLRLWGVCSCCLLAKAFEPARFESHQQPRSATSMLHVDANIGASVLLSHARAPPRCARPAPHPSSPRARCRPRKHSRASGGSTRARWLSQTFMSRAESFRPRFRGTEPGRNASSSRAGSSTRASRVENGPCNIGDLARPEPARRNKTAFR